MKLQKFSEYSEIVHSTAMYPSGPDGHLYVYEGFANEVGELLGILKKTKRGDYKFEDVKDKLLDELSDVCWYLFEMLRLNRIDASNLLKTDDIVYFQGQYKDNVNENLVHKNVAIIFLDAAVFLDYLYQGSRGTVPMYIFEKLAEAFIAIAAVAWQIGSNMQEVMQYNAEKLAKRKKTNTIKGSGSTIEERKKNAKVQTTTGKPKKRRKVSVHQKPRVRKQK